jgi:CubicO group peptidase (beta-lactamase class C family)
LDLMRAMSATELAMDLARLTALLTAVSCSQGCTLAKTIVHNFAGLDDAPIFASRTIARSGASSPLRSIVAVPRSLAELEFPDENGRTWRLDHYLDHTRTAAFVALHGDRVVFERYARGYDERSLLNSFSITKAVVATLVGIAVAEGHVSLDETVAHYRPEFAGTPYGAVKVRDLLTMTSGVVDRPLLLPGSAKYYYDDDLHSLAAHAVSTAAGPNLWHYSNADVQVLAFVLERAVGKSLSAYLSEKLWKPLGMESDALWSLDREGGVEKAFCCLRARARDFVRFGRLYLLNGRWNGAQIVPPDWAARSVLPPIATPFGYVHQHLWWAPADAEDDFFAYGHNGQYLYVNPKARVVIVKFSETNHQDPVPMFRAIASALTRPEAITELARLDAQRLAPHRAPALID